MTLDLKLYVKHWFIDDKLLSHLSKCCFPVIYDGIHYILDIRDSIHYNALETGDYDMYHHYVTRTNQREHSVENFQKLQNNFDIDKMQPIQIHFEEDRYIVSDGTHRLSIMAHRSIMLTEKHILIK